MSRLRRIIEWLPRDMSLPEGEFRSRHRAMTAMLVLHVPVLFAFGFLVQGFEPLPLAVELAFPVVAALLGALPMVRQRLRTFAVTTGLIYSSVVLLHLSGGAAESSLHFLIVLAFVFLYREWFLFAWAIVLMGFSYKLLELTQGALGELMPATSGEPEMALWALMTAASIASIGLVLAWKSAADSQAATIAALETARERDEAAARRDAYGKMYVNLARRSQSLVDRQLSVIDDLEQEVEDPDILAGVFELDHLTTRIRRHGESLLVVADVDLARRTTEPVPLSDVVRGAQSEIEQYRRVDARIDPSIAIEGPVTRDLVHLLAELLDNATTYSPPSTTVKVHARAGDGGSVVLTVEDRGLGLTPERLAQANHDLQDTEALDENSIRHLGFRVIARLAEKHGITVRLTSTNGGGVTAWIQIPEPAVASADTSDLAPARLPEAVAAAAAEAPAGAPEAPEQSSQPTAPAAPPTATPAPPSSPAAPIPSSPAPASPAPASPAPAPPTAAPERPSQPAPPASPAQTPSAPAPPATPAPAAREQSPSSNGDDPQQDVDTTQAPASPAPMPAGFSAKGRRRRGRRSLSSLGRSHDHTSPRATPRPPAPSGGGEDATPPPVPRPAVDQSLPTGAAQLPDPSTNGAHEQSRPGAPQLDPLPARQPRGGAPEGSQSDAADGASDGPPPLPRRERGATQQSAKDEALDLFGELEGGSGRSSLGDFQRGQETARREARE